MSPQLPPNHELHSWKDIAAYLNVSVRTAQKWERERGLPVTRLPGSRSRVVLSLADLEKWVASTKPAEAATEAELEPLPAVAVTVPVRSRARIWWATGLAIVVLCAAAASAWFWMIPNVPAAFRFERNKLIVQNEDGRELWRAVYPYDVLGKHSMVWFGDLDGDGKVETLVAASSGGRVTESEPLICYSQTGQERWRAVPTRRVVSGAGQEFLPPFLINAFAVFGDSNNRRIALLSQHDMEYASQVAVLSAQGKLLREYWHSGGMTSVAVAKLGGRLSLIIGGIANGYHAADLVVLDPQTLGGASREENSDYQLQGFGTPVERARILFPRACMNKLAEPYNGVSRVEVRGQTIIAEVTQSWIEEQLGPPVIAYAFDQRLQLESVSAYDNFVVHHLRLQNQGLLDHAYDGRELVPLRDVRFLTPFK